MNAVSLPPGQAPDTRERIATPVLIARCEGVSEPDGVPCHGELRFTWGRIEAACDTCGGRCGIAVAAWIDVQPNARTAALVREGAAEARADELVTRASQITARADEATDEEVAVALDDEAARLNARASALRAPSSRGETS